MKFMLLKNGLVFALLLYLSGCSVDHTGLAPLDIEGQVYTTNCRVLIDYFEDGVPITQETTEMQEVCSNGAPEEALLLRSCEVVTQKNEENYIMLRGPSARVSFFEPVSSTLNEGAAPCYLPAQSVVGEGEVLSRTDMLINSASAELRADEIGELLAKNSLTNSLAVLVDSEVIVGAKFLDWRFANTTASGEVNFDRFNCKEDKTCDLVLRQISLKLDDFTIVRPTVFARDVAVTDASLYSVTSHSAEVDSEGRFTVDDVNVVVTSMIDGEKVTLLSGQNLKIIGQFNDYLHGQSHAALTLKVEIKHANERFAIDAKANFQVRKFPSKLAVGTKNPMCLTGGAFAIYREARVSQCDVKQHYQVWHLEQKGRYLRIRQPLNNTCLNVKSKSQNYDGGIVSIVNCSDHYDQLWSIDHDFNVVNLHTRKCLDVGRNKGRNEDDLVTIHSCEVKANGQNWSVRRPS